MADMTVEQALAVVGQSAAALEYAGANRRGVESVRQALATLRAELDGLQADAERYRYAVRCGLIFLETDKDEVDSYIDAAMQTTDNAQNGLEESSHEP